MQVTEQEMKEYIEKYATIFTAMAKDMINHKLAENANSPIPDISHMQKLMDEAVSIEPSLVMQHQLDFISKQTDLWQNTAKALMGEEVTPLVKPTKSDRRFMHDEWEKNPFFEYIKQAYLLNAELLTNLTKALKFKDQKAQDRATFFTRQYINSMAPTNFVLTNPDACEEILKTNGESLVKGMQNFFEDFERSPLEAFKINQTDSEKFTLGENLASTPGKVVFKNELIELLHYEPTTAKQFAEPHLVVPPFINKYYILDLTPDKSYVAGLLDAGHQVFMISWVNPDASLAHLDFADYMKLGPIAALTAVKDISQSAKVHCTGFCVGGTLLSTTTAYLRAIGDNSIASLTLLTTPLDFSEPGEVINYISEDMLPLIEQNAELKGIFDGRILAMGFSMLRENSLFWSFFIENYLKGKDPAPFDVLYWNGDSTNLTAECFKQYLHMTYWENKLKTPGAVVIDGVPIDFGKIDVPCYFLATIADHIVLWQTAYAGTQLVSGDCRFVLAGSGHIAGVINSVKKGKYPHWTNDQLPTSAEDWLASATEHQGSWWNDWYQWLAERQQQQITAVSPGAHKSYPIIEDAPGGYVKVRLDE